MDTREPAGDPIPAPSLYEWLLWALRRRLRLRVTGDSMLPTLMAGDLVLVDNSAYRHDLPVPGDVVVVRHPYQKDLIIIKRVTAVTPEGRITVRSDNPRVGSDSRQFGTLAPGRLIGRVTAHLAGSTAT
jgi:nickel-type superoxide dismutase maturation protease